MPDRIFSLNPQTLLHGQRVTAAVWLGVGWAALVIGAIGVVLPLLPTTPFVILAAAAFGKSNPRLRLWLIRHRTLGPMISVWEEHGAIPRRGKRLAYVAMVLCFVMSALLGAPLYAMVMQVVCLCAVAFFIATRRDTPSPCPGDPASS